MYSVKKRQKNAQQKLLLQLQDAILFEQNRGIYSENLHEYYGQSCKSKQVLTKDCKHTLVRQTELWRKSDQKPAKKKLHLS